MENPLVRVTMPLTKPPSWRGKQVSGNDLMVFPRAAELAATSNLDFHVYTCSFPEELLATISDAIGLTELDDLREDATVMRCRASAIESVRKCLGQVCTTIRSSALPLADQGLLDLSTRDLPVRLLSVIATSHASCSPETSRKRELALLRAENYVEQYASEDIDVRDICRAAQVSQRTLEYAFVERFGLTPKGFRPTRTAIGCVGGTLENDLLRRVGDPTAAPKGQVLPDWSNLGQFGMVAESRFMAVTSPLI